VTLVDKQQRMKARQPVRRGRPFGPRRDFDLADTQHRLRVFFLRSKGLSIALVAAETGANPLWIARWEEKGCPLM
jgi:hypothetical protein